MKFSTFAGTSITPLLARLVLCAAFIPAGLYKLRHETRFEGPDAQILKDLEIGSELTVFNDGDARPAAIVPASWTPRQDDPPATGTLRELREQAGSEAETQDPANDSDPPAGAPDPPADDPAAGDDDEPAMPAVMAEPRMALEVHAITVALATGFNKQQNADWIPYLAWTAAITEALGGALLLLGLFTRVWGLGLAIAMGFAFWLTSLGAAVPDANVLTTLSGMWSGEVNDQASFHRIFCQLGLFVLALSLFFTGAGPLSLDRLLFKRRSDADGDGGDDDQLEI